MCDLTDRTVDGDVCALGVHVALPGERARVAACVLGVLGVHQSQRPVSKWDPEAVQLHVLVPGRRVDSVPRLTVVGEDVGDVHAIGEAPLKGGVVQVIRGRAGEGEIAPLISSYSCPKSGVGHTQTTQTTDTSSPSHLQPSEMSVCLYLSP